MRNVSGILLILALLAVFLVPGILRPGGPAAQAPAQEGPDSAAPAATVAFYYPIVARQFTATPTATATPTRTPTPEPYRITTGGLSGDIYFKESWHFRDGAYHFYAIIEPIRFLQWFFNNRGDSIERYMLTGVNVRWPDDHAQFHTSRTGAPDFVGARCYGPNGNTPDWTFPQLRCGSDIGNGQHEDYIGYYADVNVSQPGLYKMQYYACQSSTVSECQSGGIWSTLGNELQFIADMPPAGMMASVTPLPLSEEVCQLIMTDETHGRLECVPREP